MNNIDIYSAGVLPYSIKDNTIYFLLGRDSDGKWSDFGGHCEANDKNSHPTTASREFFEESLGCIYDLEFTKKILKYKKCPLIISKTNSGYPYYMYLIKISHNNIYRDKFLSTKNFINNSVIKFIDKKYLEKHDVRWFSIDTLYHCVENKSMITLRNNFSNTIKNNNLLDLINFHIST